MKARDPKEIKKFCDELWTSDRAEVEVKCVKPDLVEIKVYAMYESPALNLPLLMKLAEFFETKNVNDDDRFSSRGCDTCDYESEYGFTLTVRPE